MISGFIHYGWVRFSILTKLDYLPQKHSPKLWIFYRRLGCCLKPLRASRGLLGSGVTGAVSVKRTISKSILLSGLPYIWSMARWFSAAPLQWGPSTVSATIMASMGVWKWTRCLLPITWE